MRWLRRISTDLGEGRNLEVYLTIVVGLALGILGAFSIVRTDVIAAVILATLALLAFSTINSRDQIAILQGQVSSLSALVEHKVLGQARADEFFHDGKPDYEAEFQRAKKVYVVGVTLSRTVRDHLRVFEQKLREGAELRFAVIDPDSVALTQAARRSHGVSEEANRTRLDMTFHNLNILADVLASLPKPKGSLKLRLLPFAPSFGLLLIDPDEADGSIYVDVYLHKSLEENPVFALHARRDGWPYQRFHQQFQDLWQIARPTEANDLIRTEQKGSTKP